MKQLVGVVGVGAFVFIVSLIFWKMIAATIGIRVSAEEEIEGLDIGEHGNVAYPDFVTVAGRGSALVDSSGQGSRDPPPHMALRSFPRGQSKSATPIIRVRQRCGIY